MPKNHLSPESESVSVPYWVPDFESNCVDSDFDDYYGPNSEINHPIYDDGSMESEFESLFDSDDIVASKARIRLGY